jgi:undecaprenyl-diphosphatase
MDTDELAMNSGERARRRTIEQLEPVQWTRARLPLVFMLMVTFLLLGMAASRTDAFELDVRFTGWIQRLDWRLLRWGTDLTNWTMSGRPLTIGAITVVLILLVRGWPIDAMMLASVILVRLLNSGMKAVFASPRPTSDLVQVVEDAKNYGFPSGHASGSLLVVGTIAWIITRHVASPIWRVVIWLIAAGWIILTGIGRVRVGAHWPSDVLGAWLWGMAVMILITWGFEWARARQAVDAPGTE